MNKAVVIFAFLIGMTLMGLFGNYVGRNQGYEAARQDVSTMIDGDEPEKRWWQNENNS